jgi:hypothetical protein
MPLNRCGYATFDPLRSLLLSVVVPILGAAALVKYLRRT